MTDLKKTGRDHAGRWAPGNSGNPAGKPKGSRNHAIRTLETLMGDSAEDVAKAIIRAAQTGDTSAARLVLERVMPARKDNPIAVDLPDITGPHSLLDAGKAILAAVAGGDITPNEGDALMTLIERQARIAETANLEARITALEAKK